LKNGVLAYYSLGEGFWYYSSIVALGGD
jgi:hypothetical protein